MSSCPAPTIDCRWSTTSPAPAGHARWTTAVVAGVVAASVVALSARSLLLSPGWRGWPIPGAPGYRTYGGPTGPPLAVGSPWGRPCQAVLLWIAPGMPAAVYAQIETAVLGARDLGVDITLTRPDTRWEPGQLYPPGQSDSTVQFVNFLPAHRPTPSSGQRTARAHQLRLGRPGHVRRRP
jgi:hypothetical protein